MERARRFCSTPNCPNLTDGGPCATCRAKRDRARGSATSRGYDVAWARYSKAWLLTHRWCGERADFRLHPEHSRCAQMGVRTRATVTDHIQRMRDGGAKFDPLNHQSLCTGCHNRKGIAHEGAFARV